MKYFIKLQTPTIELKIEAKDSSGEKDSFLAGFKRYDIKEADAKLTLLREVFTGENSMDELISFMKGEIVYLKNVKLNVEEDSGKKRELVIADTRNLPASNSLWETPEECLDMLTDMFLSSMPYRKSLIEALQKALVNAEFGEAEAKN